jgi:ubiquinone/menaquinone biosynthesis C-methylase UbiE
LKVQVDEGDAENLPYPDTSFDIVMSLIGSMFAPRPELVAAELIRVCKPGGRIIMGNWTPDGHIGQMFKVIGEHVPPPPIFRRRCSGARRQRAVNASAQALAI